MASEAVSERERRENVVALAALSETDEDDNKQEEAVTEDCPEDEGTELALNEDGAEIKASPLSSSPEEYGDSRGLQKAAGCFKRQIALLRTLDRLSAPLPTLEPKVDL